MAYETESLPQPRHFFTFPARCNLRHRSPILDASAARLQFAESLVWKRKAGAQHLVSRT